MIQIRKAVLTLFLLSFLAAGHASSQQRIKIALWGDSRENLDNACENIASILLHDITDWDIQVHTGDFTHHGQEEDWQRTLHFKGIDSLFVPGRILMCTSNHDASSPENRAVWDRHTAGVLPINSADSSTHFYSWDKGNVHIVCCDAFFTDSTVMVNWLNGYLNNIPDKDWLIGVWHNPDYADLSYKEGYLEKSLPWLTALAKHGGDFVFHGHAHIYLRTKGLLPDGTIDEERGMVHIINGTGGASWKEPAAPNRKIAYTPVVRSFPCITFLTFEGNTVSLQTVDARPGKNLQVIDNWRWTQK